MVGYDLYYGFSDHMIETPYSIHKPTLHQPFHPPGCCRQRSRGQKVRYESRPVQQTAVNLCLDPVCCSGDGVTGVKRARLRTALYLLDFSLRFQSQSFCRHISSGCRCVWMSVRVDVAVGARGAAKAEEMSDVSKSRAMSVLVERAGERRIWQLWAH